MCLNPKIYPTTSGKFVSCGKCIECRMARTREWAYRIYEEASLYAENDFLTLTYSPSYLPDSGSLRPKDLQDFLKRLRKAISPRKVRFFACGEYGKKGGRPHMHVILFGYRFADRYYFGQDSAGSAIYRSPTLEKLWQYGFSGLGDLTSESCFYVAKYLQKQISGKTKPFLRMSNRPGIGYRYILDRLYLFDTDKLYLDGRHIPLPRYYIRSISADGLLPAIRVQEERKRRFLASSAPDFDVLALRAEKFSKNLGISLDKVYRF